MTKIAFIGAGSTQFTQTLVGDVLGFPALADSATLAPSSSAAWSAGASKVPNARIATPLPCKRTSPLP